MLCYFRECCVVLCHYVLSCAREPCVVLLRSCMLRSMLCYAVLCPVFSPVRCLHCVVVLCCNTVLCCVAIEYCAVLQCCVVLSCWTVYSRAALQCIALRCCSALFCCAVLSCVVLLGRVWWVGGRLGMLVRWRIGWGGWGGGGREEGELFTWSKVEYLDLSVMTSSR